MTVKLWAVVAIAALMPHVLYCASPGKKTKSVTTLINSKWEATPFTLEIAEYLAEENKDSLWNFIDEVSALSPPLVDLGTDQQIYEKALAVGSRFISSSQSQLLKLALSLHIYAPKIEMYSQMAKEHGVVDKGCPCAVLLNGRLICHPSQLEESIANELESTNKVPSESFRVDHHYPGSENRSLVAVLYGEIGTYEFAQFHKVLKTQASEGKLGYILRHYVKERPNRKLRLSGYGVELQMKSTEYKAQDDTEVKGGAEGDGSQEEKEDEEIEGFNFNVLKSLYPDKIENLDKFRQGLIESSNEMAPLKAWQFQELSLQAAERIMSSSKDEALHVLTHIAQNFPLQARTLVRTVVNPELKKEMKQNQDLFSTSLNLQPQDTAIFVNGMFFDLDVVDVISLLEIIRQEQRLMQGLHTIGVSDKKMNALMSLDLSSGLGGNTEYGIDIRDSAVFWVNDIENDKAYKRWPSPLRDLLRPTFPGMLRSIRRNLFNLVIIADPSKLNSFSILKLAESFIHHQSPLHIGIVLATSPDSKQTGLTDASVALLNGYNYAVENGSPSDGLSFLTDVYAAIKTENRDVKVEDVHKKLKSKYKGVDLEDVFGADSDYNTGRKLAREFVERSGFRNLPQALMNGIPLSDKMLTADEFEEAVLSEIMSQTPIYQKAVYKGELRDSDNVIDFIMERPNIMPRLNERILNSENNRQIDLMRTVTSVEESISPPVFSLLGSSDQSALMVSTMRYFSPRKQSKTYFLTNWIVADLTSSCAKGRNLLQSALKQMKSSGAVRVGLIVNPIEGKSNDLLNRIALAALKVLSPDEATTFMLKLLDSKEVIQQLLAGEKKLSALGLTGINVAAVETAADTKPIKDNIKRHIMYVERTLGLNSGDTAVVSNGRVLGPLETTETFTVDDFSLLERHSFSTHIEKIKSALQPSPSASFFDEDDIEDTTELTSDVALRIVSLLVSHPQTRSRFEIPTFTTDHSVINIPASRPKEPAIRIDVIVDPVSRGAQRIGPILTTFQTALNCHIRVFLNSVEKNSDMPLKSFYRFVLEPELQFTPEGQLTAGPIARFTNLPEAPLLTQNLQVPENWLVESVASPYDLDNIRLEDVVGNVHSEYELEYLLLEGHCFEAMTGNPPRGLQITLGTEKEPVKVDTIVMANLGYFQLKANPGAWVLRLRQGRSADLFDIVSHDGSDTPPNSTDIKVVISSFRSHVLKLRVQKKPDKMNIDLLSEDDDANNPGIWNSITSTFGSNPKQGEEEPEEKLNIFSVASGHLYERFLRIMMLSVLKQTKTPVKFWFLKNYLSPTFKDFLPHMAREFGFEYELVQYKWPRWLHQQTEKQRIIWGYKILFLDVLFPLDVKKFIFVDADQVVRADLKELHDLDLGGAPYGYTPFCESRKEMDGFRFWKQGYWRSHLQGRRYHISALYVVDLKRFRRIAAGDRLRGQYQALSQDPNSLSNLDQDLPNNMIHQVSIKSLPQEWLWCETWCDDASKQNAKTIDLCNNPLTKEAKLTAAMRILPEWKGYDEQIKKLQQKVESEALDAHSEFHHSQPSKLSNNGHLEKHTEL
ncbi:hypothetical protein FOCC_FOCC006890 [Frankliniella occidentalis]|uniref:UDP-glucose:glycoprotein glucosyltransferase isoform X1 n=1 Tax=Frankliniella occidentalis TaxID=133901 RepID=A0A6J1SIJ1_FRAOC|nr:UDP-glucose:glycoprotein glucosyltransferase isoform X1 [Frankliniella occidentalis]KAE8746395.1 hypothetical protein FOCC_FOCC006890 [Frankliniella occidentalis]